MPSLPVPAFCCDDDEQGAPDLVVLVSVYECDQRAVLTPRRRGDE